MACEGSNLAPGLGVPDARGLVLRGSDHARAVRAESGGRKITMAFEGRDLASPVSASQMRAVLSSEAVTTHLLSTEGGRMKISSVAI